MLTPYIPYIVEGLVFLVVVAVVLAATGGVTEQARVRQRMAGMSNTRATPQSELLKRQTVSNPFLVWVQATTSLNDIRDLTKVRRTLAFAGYTSPAAPTVYVVIRYSLAVGLPLCFWIWEQFAPNPLDLLGITVVSLLLCGLGLIIPSYVVEKQADSRKTRLQHEFPDALDLMVICVQAGLGLESAFVRVGIEVRNSHRRIAEEFTRVSEELGAGRRRADALRAMADRTNLDSVKSFTALLIQTDTLGTSIGQTLKIYAGEMRSDRFLKAEEKAMRIPVLMTIPLVSCILPVVIAALLLPPIIDVMRTLLPALAGKH